MLSKSSFFLVILALLFWKCSSNNNQDFYTITGKAQGTTYSIILIGQDVTITKNQITTILENFDSVLSTYVSSSNISQFNSADNTFEFSDSNFYFKNCLLKSQFIYDLSQGAFDPTVVIDGRGRLEDAPRLYAELDTQRLLKAVINF